MASEPTAGRKLPSSAVVCAAVVTALGMVVWRLWPSPATNLGVNLQRVLGGGLLTLALLIVVWFLLRLRLHSAPLAAPPWRESTLDSPEKRRHDAEWFVHLRWLAAAVALGLTFCARPEARALLLSWWAGLVAANILFELLLRRFEWYETQILIQAIVDLVFLTGFLNASGGLENPLSTIFIFHVIVARILLPPHKAAAVTVFAVAMFSLMAFGEYVHLLPHYTNSFFPHPQSELVSPGHEGHGPGDATHAAYDLFFVLGRTLPFLFVLFLTDLFVGSVMRRLRISEHGMQQSISAAVLERERLERVIDAAGAGMMQLDADLSLRWFSGRVPSWFGWTQEAIGHACPLLAGSGACDVCVSRAAIDSGEPATVERETSGPHVGSRFFRHTSSPIRDGSGAVVQVVEVIEDVTARRALEEEAIRAEKLSVLGRMAAGIAHEIGNPLSSISARLRLLERRREEGFVTQSVDVLREQIERIARIVQGISHFGRVRPRERSVLAINEVIDETIGVIELDRRSRSIRFVRELEGPSPRVYAVRDQIGQILLNLLLNAVEASPSEGTVIVRSWLAGREVCVSVDDEGPGIDAQSRDHLFEPFFSTKPRGTGLGLSISYGFATAHGGRIEVERNAAGGASFILVLPAHDEAASGEDRESRESS